MSNYSKHSLPGRQIPPPASVALRLHRETFRTSRLMDFCSERELTAQTGHERKDWPLVILKEAVDNALDACEEAGVSPQITVTVDGTGISVQDNGPGIPTKTVQGICDFSLRVSSREAYISPCRGAQGNAMKTLLAMPFVLEGRQGRVDIGSYGRRHELTVALATIRQEPIITSVVCESDVVKTGTAIKVWWPDSASSLLNESKARFLQVAHAFTVLNPHLSLTVNWFGEPSVRIEATDCGWAKWRPSDPTCPHWYTPEDFERLVSAYIAHDQDDGTDRSIREFIAEFRGLTGTGKQKAVLKETGLARTNLSALVSGDDLNRELVGKLLASMQFHCKPVKPPALGIIGRDHLHERFSQLGCEMETFQYKRICELSDRGVPSVVETAFAWRGDDRSMRSRHLITGVNWSPGITNPFRDLNTDYGDGLAALLEKRRAGPREPIILFLHCVCPRVRYADRGKATVLLQPEVTR